MVSNTTQTTTHPRRRRDDVVGATPAGEPAAAAAPRLPRRIDRPGWYLVSMLVLTLVGLAGIWRANIAYAPEMYDPKGSRAIAETLARGNNFATFDLNVNIREIRDAHFERMTRTPEVAILGASHWQEAHAGLMPQKDFFNAHVHRDYYEDMIGVVEMLVRHDRLPKQVIIAVRDLLFLPISKRTDYLWLPIVPYYEAGARRLGIKPHPRWETAPYQRWKEVASLQMLHGNVVRWHNADVKPHESRETRHDSLDLLLPDGSILWSEYHKTIFTQARAREMSLSFAAENANRPPPIDPKGLAHFDTLLAFLKNKGVDVYFVHPPFNPIYWERVQGTPYLKGLAEIERITKDFAAKYDFRVFGSFNPHDIGCTAEMYIDAEHSNPECLGKVFAQFLKIDRSRSGDTKPQAPAANDAIAMTTPSQQKTHAPPADTAKAQARPHAAPAVINVGAASLPESDAAGAITQDLSAARLAPRPAHAAIVIDNVSGGHPASRLYMPARIHDRDTVN